MPSNNHAQENNVDINLIVMILSALLNFPSHKNDYGYLGYYFMGYKLNGAASLPTER